MADKGAAPPADSEAPADAAKENHTTLTVPPAPANKAPSDASTSTAVQVGGDVAEAERCCWICFATDEDNRLAAWVKPCQCRGTTKWVHQSCLYRWIDEKTQKGNALRSVSCPQCQTEYIIVFPQMGKFGGALEAMDNLIKRLSPFLAAGFFVGSLYWTAVTYGAVTFLQIVGHEHGMSIMEAGDPLVLLIGLPAIPVGLVLGRLIRWEDALLRLIRNRGTVVRKFPFVSLIYPNLNQDEDQPSTSNPATPALSDPVSATRVFCGALLLPTISSIVGRILFDSVDNTLHRTLLGGLTFITVKGILKIYLKQKQYGRRKKRRIVDYTEENIRNFMHRNNNNAANAARQDQQPQQRPVPPVQHMDAVITRQRGDSGGSVV
ncbi:E3 ubiquitin-protein ligase MARCHF5 [Drosophila takahashii]|uniref:E3 ubiquitin-protein ligase MARCHF5 n=1 Tax=Drosophila takahashii TaxID=29030 RepID=UPI0007E72AB1|nr:E3 ubiquitin-protein ligase MARCHF5 [Drosophila takahashii]XP_016992905.1 E3 ubiquitin-protein ligase MARCHF5 [Drosophila takahashii]XP_016992906.1 E3 ubiquitin-protein ligase MARCHF5 [Drosophila takahashii]